MISDELRNQIWAKAMELFPAELAELKNGNERAAIVFCRRHRFFLADVLEAFREVPSDALTLAKRAAIYDAMQNLYGEEKVLVMRGDKPAIARFVAGKSAFTAEDVARHVELANGERIADVSYPTRDLPPSRFRDCPSPEDLWGIPG